MSIQQLPPDVIAQIKSSIAITSLNGVVCELVKNSLDASSTKIDISVDYPRGGCIVEDDGSGILPAEFREGGGLGMMYPEQRETRSWWTWHFSRLSIVLGFVVHHVSSSFTSFAQHA
ncbi:DNA mismatch repair protein MutL [Lachnellula suecica]|uniref:DNA mismatch repair protein MutL n=1 Tax=Lachnellula suecica TaxID=602035 RepID=A0A8T9CE18_9HELO|nr:DNA mismatch repair protein MutL [Lachnellula suecica]